ncbi:MAG: glycosyltransferase family protein [Myxococcota bacterium]
MSIFGLRIPALSTALDRPRALGKRAVKQVAFELAVHGGRLRHPRRRPRVVVFPSNQPWDAASNLRAWLVAPELRRRGWRVTVVPEPLNLAQRRRVLKLEQPDVVVLQQTRHPLNQPHLYAPVPCVLDADDADCLDPRHRQRIARCARDASAVIGGNRFIAEQLGQHNPDASVLWTATPRPRRRSERPPSTRGPIVAWAHANPFLYEDEAAFVREVLRRLARRRPFMFWLFGTVPGPAADDYLAPIRAAGSKGVAVPPMPYPSYLRKVSEAAVGIQPVCTDNPFSRGKSFGKLLAYLAGEVAVVASDAVDHPLFFRHGDNGLLADGIDSWVEALDHLLTDAEDRARMARTAYRDFERTLTTEAFARNLEPVLWRAAARGVP